MNKSINFEMIFSLVLIIIFAIFGFSTYMKYCSLIINKKEENKTQTQYFEKINEDFVKYKPELTYLIKDISKETIEYEINNMIERLKDLERFILTMLVFFSLLIPLSGYLILKNYNTTVNSRLNEFNLVYTNILKELKNKKNSFDNQINKEILALKNKTIEIEKLKKELDNLIKSIDDDTVDNIRHLVEKTYKEKYYSIAAKYIQGKEYKFALDYFMVLENENFKPIDVKVNIGRCNQELGNVVIAEEYFQSALKLAKHVTNKPSVLKNIKRLIKQLPKDTKNTKT